MKNKKKIIVGVLLLLLVGSAVGWNIWSGTGHLTGNSADKQKMDEEQDAVSGEQEAENADSDHSKQDEKTGKSKNSRKQSSATKSEQWEEAEHTPMGKYPETVTYTLGKMSGADHSFLPVGNTYENNGYTRYLKKQLNIQNQNLIELEDNGAYNEAVAMAIADKEIPDLLVVNGRENLINLVKSGMIEDLTTVYEECTTDTIKEMYGSYGSALLDSASVDGKLYAFPNTAIDDGEMLLWLRDDWIRELGMEEPETMEEAMKVIHAFVEHDMAGDGQTIGLACSTGIFAGTGDTYGVDAVFSKFGAVPQKWILNEENEVVYGSLTDETKQALGYLHELYEEGILDSRFLLRKTENIDELVRSGHCGAIFGRWWAPNNPLSFSYAADKNADWKPYLVTENEGRKVRTFESYDDWMYVVVRKGYEHPEIVGKYVSTIFDYARYTDENATEINEYFALNVDPTARPLNINVDYIDALYRASQNIQAALDKKLSVSELTGLEKSYYDTCCSYLNGNLTTANAWAAYASRIEAAGLLADSIREPRQVVSMGEENGEIPQALQELQSQTFLQIIAGEKPVDYFDTFVVEWYANGGQELTDRVRDAYEKTKD